MARRTPHHAERPQDRRVPLTWPPLLLKAPGAGCLRSAISGSTADRGAEEGTQLTGRSPTNAPPPTKAQPSPSESPGSGCLHRRFLGAQADSMSRGRYPLPGRASSKALLANRERHPAHGALSIEGTLPFIRGPSSPNPTGFRTNPMGTFPPCEKPVGPAKSPSTPLPHERPRATGKSGATTRRQPWPIPSSNESGNTPSTRA